MTISREEAKEELAPDFEKLSNLSNEQKEEAIDRYVGLLSVVSPS